MPTISQLPAAGPVSASDEVPISQGGSVCAVAVGELLVSTQSAILVQSPSLIGRTSLGSGGPEQVDAGVGLLLAAGTIVATGGDHAGFPSSDVLLVDSDLVISNQGSQMLMATQFLRGLFSAGANVTIDSNGVIAADSNGTVTAQAYGDGAIASLQVVPSIASADLVPVSQSGTDYAVGYANFIDGVTIDNAAGAAAASSTDTLWVAQGSNVMARQSFAAIWLWLCQQLPSYTSPVVEITASCSLQAALHNGRVLVCSQPVTLSPSATGMANGFRCQVINVSSGNVILGAGFQTSTGSLIVASEQSVTLQCIVYSGGTIFYGVMGQSSGLIAAPGQVASVSTQSVTATSVTLAWSAPASGGSPTSYVAEYRVTGSSSWTASAALTATTYQITGLQSATSYDFQVQAVNATAAGAFSPILTASTSTVSQPVAAPGQVTGVTVSAVSSAIAQVIWTSLSGGNAAVSYTAQYRVTGSTAWILASSNITASSFQVTGLLASTSYDFTVFGVNAGGSGPISAVVSLTMPAAAIPVPGAVTNVSAVPNSTSSVTVSWSAQSGTNAAVTYTVQYRVDGSTAWTTVVPGITATTYNVTALQAGTKYDFAVVGVNATGSGQSSAVVSATTNAAGNSVSSITWNVGPSGPYTHGSGVIALNAHVAPITAAIQFGFSTSPSSPPGAWTAAQYVNTDLWGNYVATPASAGTWYAWAEGLDGSCPTVFGSSFLVQ